MPRVLNRAETAEHLGVSEPTLDRWVRDGCPFNQRGGRGVEWQFDLPVVVRWWGNRRASEAAAAETQDIAEIELRTRRAIMQKAEVDAAKARGEIALISEFEKVQSKAMAAIRVRIMQVPQRVVVRLLGETRESVFKDVITEELRTALESASESDLSIDEDDDEQP